MKREPVLVARVELAIDAQRERVWAGITDLARYMPIDDVVADWRPGGRIRWTAVLLGRKRVEVDGDVETVDAEHFLVFRWRDPLLKVTHRVLILLELDGARTRLILTEDGHATEKELAHAEGGWRLMLSNLKFQLEERAGD